MDKAQVLEELRMLGFRLQNGPGFSGYADIKPEAMNLVCDLLGDLGCGDVAERFRAIMDAPLEEA